MSRKEDKSRLEECSSVSKSHLAPLSLKTEYCCFTCGIKDLKQKGNMGISGAWQKLEEHLGMLQFSQDIYY